MTTDDLVLAAVFVLLGLWFFWRNRREISGFAIVRHVIFIASIYAGSLTFWHTETIMRWVFGRQIPKGDPQEFIAGPVPLIACLLCFAVGTIALGKDRVRHFKLYIKTFSFKKPPPPE